MFDNIKIWINGEMRPHRDATVGVLSPTAQFGLNVFEGIRCYWNAHKRQLFAFRLDDHFARLSKSCRLIRIPCPYSFDQLRDGVIESVRANALRQDCAIRMTIFVDGDGSWSAVGPVGMFIAPIPRPRANLTLLEGKRACVSSWERINDNCMPPRIKAGANYINGRYAHLDAVANGFDLPILLDQKGMVAEGAGACCFVVRGSKLYTPPIGSSILESITRQTIIEFCGGLGLDVVERDIARTELYIADEIFLCGTSAEITPITTIDHYTVGDGRPGAITTALLEKYLSIVSGEDELYDEWRTSVYPPWRDE